MSFVFVFKYSTVTYNLITSASLKKLNMYHTNAIETRVMPSFIEASTPLITNPWMRPRPTHGRNLLDLFEKDSSCESVNNTSLFKVYLRLKPIQEDVTDIYKITSETSLLTVTSDKFKRKNKVNKMYNFSRIFRPECTQREIFEVVVRDNMLDLFENKSFTLLTYGSSGSGKTYTLMGTEEQLGLIPRTLEYMFQSLSPLRHPNFKTKDGSTVEKLNVTQKMEEMKFSKSVTQRLLQGMKTYRRMSVRLSSDFQNESYLQGTERHSVWVSFCEIYNETINDLLIARDKTKTANTLKLREDTKGHCYVKGLSQIYVRSGTEAYNVMLHGQRNLRYAETGIHSHSSRSHCLFTITLITHNNGRHVVSLLRLCDLAGSERAQQTGNSGERMKESRSINSSLAVLERCLVMLKNKQNMSMSATSSDNTIAGGAGTKNLVMPVRESKLTRLLGSSLMGGGSVTMLVAVNPERTYFQESQHVLKLSAIARQLWLEPSVEQASYQDNTLDSFAQIQKESEIERLKFELSRVTKDLAVAMERETNIQVQFSDNLQEIEKVVKEAQKVTAWKYEQRLQQQKEMYEEDLEEKDEIIQKFTETEAMIKNDYEELENTLDIREREIEDWKTAFAALESTHEELRASYDALLAEMKGKDSQTEVTDRDSVTVVEPEGENVVWVVDSEGESEVSESDQETGDEEDDVDTMEHHDDQQNTQSTSPGRCSKCSDLFEDSMSQDNKLPVNSSPTKTKEEELEAPSHSCDDFEYDTEENNEFCNAEIQEHVTESNQVKSDQDGMTNVENEDSIHEQTELDVREEKTNLQTIDTQLNKKHTDDNKVESESINVVDGRTDISTDQVDVNENLEIETAVENQMFNEVEVSISAENNQIEVVRTDIVRSDKKYAKESKLCSDERSTVLADKDTNIQVLNTTEGNQHVILEELKVSTVSDEENMVSIKTPNDKAPVLVDPETSSKKGRRSLWTRKAEEEVENADNEDESPSEKLVSKPKVPMFYGTRTRRRKNM